MKVILVIFLLSCATTVIPQPNPLITDCPGRGATQNSLLALKAAIEGITPTDCANIGSAAPLQGSLANLVNALNTLADACSTTDCNQLIADLNCILAFVKSINCTCTCPINACVGLVVQLIVTKIIPVIQTAQTTFSGNNNCTSQLNTLLGAFQAAAAACPPKPNPAACTAPTAAVLAGCASVGAVGSLVGNLTTNLRGLLQPLLSTVCSALNLLLLPTGGLLSAVTCSVLNPLLQSLATVLLQVNTPFQAAVNSTNGCVPSGSITSACNQLVAVLYCILTQLLLLATDPANRGNSNTCICGILAPLVNQLLAVVNSALAGLLNAGGVGGGNACEDSLTGLQLALLAFFNCCPNSAAVCNNTLGLPGLPGLPLLPLIPGLPIIGK